MYGVVFHRGVLSRSPAAVRLIQVVNVLFAVLYALFLTRFLLEYVRAAPSPFAQWIARATDTAYLPVRELFANGHDSAGHPIAWALLVCVAAAAVVHGSVVSLLRNAARPHAEEDDDWANA